MKHHIHKDITEKNKKIQQTTMFSVDEYIFFSLGPHVVIFMMYHNYYYYPTQITNFITFF